MRANEISKHLRRQPFCPLRVFLSDGASFDVPHPEFMAVSRTEVVIGIRPGEDAVAESFVYRDLVHITRIEPINGHGEKRT